MTILLVDDDDDFRCAFADSLRDDGHIVEAVASPPSESRLRALGRVEVVVTDYHMPSGNGLTFADDFHRLYPDTPVILATTDPSGALEKMVSTRPNTHLHRKPFTYAEALGFIERTHASASR